MQTLHAMHLAELANTQSKTLYYNIDPFTERTPPPTLGRRSRRPSGADAPAAAASSNAAAAAAASATAVNAAAPTPPPVSNLYARDVETDLYDVGKLLGELKDYYKGTGVISLVHLFSPPFFPLWLGSILSHFSPILLHFSDFSLKLCLFSSLLPRLLLSLLPSPTTCTSPRRFSSYYSISSSVLPSYRSSGGQFDRV